MNIVFLRAMPRDFILVLNGKCSLSQLSTVTRCLTSTLDLGQDVPYLILPQAIAKNSMEIMLMLKTKY